MKKLLILFIGILFSLNNYGQGLIFDRESFGQGEQYEVDRSSILPDAFSLKKYAPYIFKQQYSTCVSYSIANAMTIVNAINNKETNRDRISLLTLSPHWIYFRNKDKTDSRCTDGLDIDRAINDVFRVGIPYLLNVEYKDYYPFSKIQLCDDYPGDITKNLEVASANKPDGILKIREPQSIKSLISENIPVVIGMSVPPSFEAAKNKSFWLPLNSETKSDGYGHSMVVVGYDDNKYGGAFEVLNSWGESWGDQGFIWMKYSDLKKYFICGYALYKDVKWRREQSQFTYHDMKKILGEERKYSKYNDGRKSSKAGTKWQQLINNL